MEHADALTSRPLLLQRSVLVASLSALLGSLDTAVNIAFPAITTAFALELMQIQWIVVNYVLTYASLLLGCGRLADVWGHGRVLRVGLVGSGLAFLGCGLAQTFGGLLVARVAQGVAAALVLGAAPALVTLSVPSEVRGRALGIFQMGAAVGFASGPLLGGLLVEGFGWRAVYLFRVLPALLLAVLVVDQSPPVQSSQDYQDRHRFDLLGMLTLAGSIAGFLLTVSRGRDLGWTSPLIIVLVLGASACLVGFLITETRVRAPVVNLALFRQPAFTIANLLNVLANWAMFAIWLFVPYYLVNVLQYPASVGGLLLLTAPFATAVAAPVAGRFADRFGTRRLSSGGLLVEAVGLWLLSRLDGGADSLSVTLALSVVGLGLGVFQVPNMSFVMGAIPRAQQGVAGSMSQMMRTIGVVIGVTSASLLFDSRWVAHTGQPLLQDGHALQGFIPAFQDVFLVSAGLCFVAFGCSLLFFIARVNPDTPP